MDLKESAAAPSPAPSSSPFDFPSSPAPAAFELAPSPAPGAAADPFGADFAAPVEAHPAPAPVADPFAFGPSGTVAISPAPASPSPSFSFEGASAPAGSATLTLKRGGLATAEVFTFGGSATLGRFDPDSGPVDVDLGPLPEATYVSRHHAEIRNENGQWILKDLGSRNGTFWRSGGSGQFQRVASDQNLSSGDEIALGNARFEFKAG